MPFIKTVLFTGVAGLALISCSPSSTPAKSTAKPAATAPAKVEPAPAKAEPAPEPAKVEPAKVEPAAATPEAAAPAAPRPMSAKRLYLRRTCIACHGRNGAHAIQQYPNIAGLDASYIKKQIKDIISGKRQGSPDKLTGHPRAESMRGALVTADGEARISDDEIQVLADWLSKQPRAQNEARSEALTDEGILVGKALFEKSRCRTCHGAEGNKPLKGYPHLAGQKAAYLAEQLRDIRDGARTNGRARIMLPFVRKLSDDDILAIAGYLSQVQAGE